MNSINDLAILDDFINDYNLHRKEIIKNLYKNYHNKIIDMDFLLNLKLFNNIFVNNLVISEAFIKNQSNDALKNMIKILYIDMEKFINNIENFTNKKNVECQDSDCIGKAIYQIMLNLAQLYILNIRVNKINKQLEEIVPIKAETKNKNYVRAILILFLIILLLTIVLYIVNVAINIIIYLILSRKNKHLPSFWYVLAGPLGTYYFYF